MHPIRGQARFLQGRNTPRGQYTDSQSRDELTCTGTTIHHRGRQAPFPAVVANDGAARVMLGTALALRLNAGKAGGQGVLPWSL